MDLPKDILDLVEAIPDIPTASISFWPTEGIKISVTKQRLNVEFRDWDVAFVIREGKLELLSTKPIEFELTKGEFEHFLAKLELIKFFLDNKKSASEILGLAIYQG